MRKYLAHIAEDGREQTVLEHLRGTAALSARFAAAFGAADQGELAGLLHDIGKYSDAFQRRLRGGPKVDHATAGALECLGCHQLPAAMCIAGHHGGLADLGAPGVVEGPTFLARVNRARRQGLEPYDRWRDEVDVPAAEAPGFCREPLEAAFFMRMLYSCLVDADFLDTDAFMSGAARPEQTAHWDTLNAALDAYIAPWFPPKGALNQRRCAMLRDCIRQGESDARGLFTLTVPTGGGKTVASLAFALRHARANHMDRVIYVIPYTSIIEQTADVFRDILGGDVVLEHHSGVQYDLEEAAPDQLRMARATENWDMPVVVTTAVQFFESLYANRSSSCRKLHNIANSCILFDEAQMLPLPYLQPCVHAIAQLVAHYGASAVLCTATQPALNGLFQRFLPGYPLRELCSDELFAAPEFRRVRFQAAGALTWAQLSQRVNGCEQALCIVNTRKNAQTVYDLLEQEGSYHLSTLMCPAHRRAVLAEIRQRLHDKLPCRVAATSLIEAGVDVDFPAVFREVAGLDSVLQAAGRCNREGRRPPDESVVTVFRSESNIPPLFSAAVKQAETVMQSSGDWSGKAAVRDYFRRLLEVKGERAQDKKGILRQLREDGLPFQTVAKDFHLIENDTKTVYIPWGEGAALLHRLHSGERSRGLFRALGQYSVSVYDRHFAALEAVGALELLEDGSAVLTDGSLYSARTGLSTADDSGRGLFV